MNLKIHGWEALDKYARFDFLDDLEKVLNSYDLSGWLKL